MDPSEPAQQMQQSMSSKGLLKKPWIWAIAAGLVVVIALIIYLVGFMVGPKDYETARAVIKDKPAIFAKSYDATRRLTQVSPLLPQEKVSDYLSTAETSYNDYVKASDVVRGLKVQHADGIKADFATFKKADDEYRKFASNYLKTAKVILPAVATCHGTGVDWLKGFEQYTRSSMDLQYQLPKFRKIYSSQSTLTSDLKPCTDALAQLGSIDDKDARKFMDEFKKQFEDLAAGRTDGKSFESASGFLGAKVKVADNPIDAKVAEATYDLNTTESTYQQKLWAAFDQANIVQPLAALQSSIDKAKAE